jgi:hypothetical protein
MATFPETLELEHLLDVYIDLEVAQDVGATPFGRRSIHVVKGGRFEGPRLRGTAHAGGGDWFVTLANGVGELDVRLTLETDDGALIFMRYNGVFDVAPKIVGRVFGGEDIDPASYYFRTTPRFETGDERYAWLNKLVTVAAGQFGPQRVAYRVFAVR